MSFCSTCKGTHQSYFDIQECARKKRQGAESRVTAAELPPTTAQLDFIDALAAKKGLAAKIRRPQSRSEATRTIAYLKTRPDESPRPAVNFAIVNLLESGRYAVTIGEGSEQCYAFFRVSRPTKGRYAGCLQVQSQHADNLVLRMLYKMDGELLFNYNRTIHGASLAELLTLVVVDQKKAALDYGQQLGQCARCGRELTDERSRHYSIGPECEKSWPHMIEYVNDAVGIYGERVS